VDFLLAQAEGNVADLGKAIAFGVGVGLGAVGSMIQAVARQPELRGELTGIQWLGFALTEAVVFYALLGGLLAFVLV
jgi:F-type H+-transporting ATPase subunit c